MARPSAIVRSMTTYGSWPTWRSSLIRDYAHYPRLNPAVAHYKGQDVPLRASTGGSFAITSAQTAMNSPKSGSSLTTIDTTAQSIAANQVIVNRRRHSFRLRIRRPA